VQALNRNAADFCRWHVLGWVKSSVMKAIVVEILDSTMSFRVLSNHHLYLTMALR